MQPLLQFKDGVCVLRLIFYVKLCFIGKQLIGSGVPHGTMSVTLSNTSLSALSLLPVSVDPPLTDTLRLLPLPRFRCPAPRPQHVPVLSVVDWTLVGRFVRWLFGLAPPPPGAGVRSQQPVVPCAPPSPSLHTRAHVQGKSQATRWHAYKF